MQEPVPDIIIQYLSGFLVHRTMVFVDFRLAEIPISSPEGQWTERVTLNCEAWRTGSRCLRKCWTEFIDRGLGSGGLSLSDCLGWDYGVLSMGNDGHDRYDPRSSILLRQRITIKLSNTNPPIKAKGTSRPGFASGRVSAGSLESNSMTSGGPV